MARDYILLKSNDGSEILPVTTSDGVFCENGTKKLTNKLEEINNTITEVQAELDKLEPVGNKEFLIASTEWTENETNYEKEIIHNLNSENLQITVKNSATKEACTVGWKIIDQNTILIKSDELVDLSVIIASSYYKAEITVSDNICAEVIQSRSSYTSLHDRLVAIENMIAELTKNTVSFSDFTETTIN